MKPIDELKAEHDSILTMLDILERITVPAIGATLPLLHVDQIIDFFEVFIERCHHRKEERFLFPAVLQRYGTQEQTGQIELLIAEHRTGHEIVAAMRQALNGLEKNIEHSIGLLTETSQRYVDLLRSHIEKENNALFPRVEEAFSEQAQEKLSRQFELIEKEEIGWGKHEEYHQLINTLRKAYVK